MSDSLRTQLARGMWLSTVPAKDAFGDDIMDTFIDGRTSNGQWGLMTPLSHAMYGCGLGTGRGQMYRKSESGAYYKVAG